MELLSAGPWSTEMPIASSRAVSPRRPGGESRSAALDRAVMDDAFTLEMPPEVRTAVERHGPGVMARIEAFLADAPRPC